MANDDVLRSSEISAGPQDIVAVGAKRIDDRFRKVLIGEEAHLRWNRVGLVFVGQVAGVRQAGEDVLPCQPRVVCEEFAFRLASRQELQNELDRETRPSDHWFPGQDLRVYDDALRKRHLTVYRANARFGGGCLDGLMSY